jgi:N-acetylneuraminate synthase/N,N'-diacetyllegionaminate synthase
MPFPFKPFVRLGSYVLGPGRPALVVAEIGGNHGGDPELAGVMVDAAVEAGVGAVKFQAYRTGSFLARSSAYYDELAGEELSFQVLAELARRCRKKGVLFLASVFDRDGLDFLAEIEAPAVKISSGDLTDLPLIEHAADLHVPVILSTGAAEWSEIDQALETLAQCGANQVVLLQCTSLYPCPDEDINLAAIPALQNRYPAPVGFSDHSTGVEIPLAAMALGACLVEKHFTTDQRLPGGDNEMSCLPAELETLVKGSLRVHRALGRPEKGPAPAEKKIRQAIRRSLTAGRDIKAGEVLDRNNLALKRPGDGLPPADYHRLLGCTAAVDIPADTRITPEMVV